jgi:hypothetical protein
VHPIYPALDPAPQSAQLSSLSPTDPVHASRLRARAAAHQRPIFTLLGGRAVTLKIALFSCRNTAAATDAALQGAIMGSIALHVARACAFTNRSARAQVVAGDQTCSAARTIDLQVPVVARCADRTGRVGPAAHIHHIAIARLGRHPARRLAAERTRRLVAHERTTVVERVVDTILKSASPRGPSILFAAPASLTTIGRNATAAVHGPRAPTGRRQSATGNETLIAPRAISARAVTPRAQGVPVVQVQPQVSTRHPAYE